MKAYCSIIFILVCTSCTFFETKKITSEEFYTEEFNEINWEIIDQYPAFKACERLSEKIAQKQCFEKTLASHLKNSFKDSDLEASEKVIDTMFIALLISKEAVVSVKEIKIDSLLQDQFPAIEALIFESITKITLVAPAYKRGIPVATAFVLPIVLQAK